MIFRSNVVKFTSLTFLVIALVLITIILAESPNLKDVDFKLLPNNSSKLVPHSKQTNSSLEPTTAAQQPNPNYNQPQQGGPNYQQNYPQNLIN